jgi:hypothetical protein
LTKPNKGGRPPKPRGRKGRAAAEKEPQPAGFQPPTAAKKTAAAVAVVMALTPLSALAAAAEAAAPGVPLDPAAVAAVLPAAKA